MVTRIRGPVLVGFVLAAAIAWAGVRAGRGGATAHGGGSQDCAACHQGRVQTTHDAAFVAVAHGAAAAADRRQCLGCHEQRECRDCHVRQPPSWHTDATRDPARDRRARQDHARIGIERRDGCLECHEERFTRQCGTCHRLEEWTR